MNAPDLTINLTSDATGYAFRVEYLSGRDWIYKVRIASLDDLDDEVREWLCQACEVGAQRA